MVRLCTIMMAAVAALGLSVPAAQAQTCRIAAGVAPDGSPAFIDVFEYDYVDEKPQFPGGDSKLVGFINARRRYPAEAYRRGIEGRVVCSFVVDAEGKLSHFKVLKGRPFASWPACPDGSPARSTAAACRSASSGPYRSEDD